MQSAVFARSTLACLVTLSACVGVVLPPPDAQRQAAAISTMLQKTAPADPFAVKPGSCAGNLTVSIAGFAQVKSRFFRFDHPSGHWPHVPVIVYWGALVDVAPKGIDPTLALCGDGLPATFLIASPLEVDVLFNAASPYPARADDAPFFEHDVYDFWFSYPRGARLFAQAFYPRDLDWGWPMVASGLVTWQVDSIFR